MLNLAEFLLSAAGRVYQFAGVAGMVYCRQRNWEDSMYLLECRGPFTWNPPQLIGKATYKDQVFGAEL